MPKVKSPRSSAAARAAAGGTILLLFVFAASVRAEPGERFERDTPALAAVVIADDGPAVGAVAIPRNPPHMEAARGGAVRDGLARSRPVHRPEKAAAKPPALSREIALEAAPPPRAPFLISPAYAGEPGARPYLSLWRRWLGSPYAAWVAAILLIGIPAIGVLRRCLTGWRETRDLSGYD